MADDITDDGVIFDTALQLANDVLDAECYLPHVETTLMKSIAYGLLAIAEELQALHEMLSNNSVAGQRMSADIRAVDPVVTDVSGGGN